MRGGKKQSSFTVHGFDVPVEDEVEPNVLSSKLLFDSVKLLPWSKLSSVLLYELSLVSVCAEDSCSFCIFFLCDREMQTTVTSENTMIADAVAVAAMHMIVMVLSGSELVGHSPDSMLTVFLHGSQIPDSLYPCPSGHMMHDTLLFGSFAQTTHLPHCGGFSAAPPSGHHRLLLHASVQNGPEKPAWQRRQKGCQVPSGGSKSLLHVLHAPQDCGVDDAALFSGQNSFSVQSSLQSLLSSGLLFFPFTHVRQCPGSDAKVSHDEQLPQ